MSMTMEQVVTHLQQDFTLRAQVAAEFGLADAVRAINNLATAQVRKDTPSLIDVKGLGRPNEFSGKEEAFQQWSKKTEAFFAGAIKESEMIQVFLMFFFLSLIFHVFHFPCVSCFLFMFCIFFFFSDAKNGERIVEQFLLCI